MTYDELMSALYDLMKEDPADLEEQVDELLDENDGDMEDAFLAAVQADNFGYVRDHVDEVDLMTEDGSTSPYVEEAGSEEMRQELIDDGASVYLGDVTDGHDFAWNVETDEVLEGEYDFPDTVLTKVLESIGLTVDGLAEAALAEAEAAFRLENEDEEPEEEDEEYEAEEFERPVPGEYYDAPWEDEDGVDGETPIFNGFSAFYLAYLFRLTWDPQSTDWSSDGFSDLDEFVDLVRDMDGFEEDSFEISAPHGHGSVCIRWFDAI